ncbi:chaperonin GroEL [Candidatus Peregrinibacteria bacterium]|nr:MAG: chaperonin GroEL [Candidatus Peregrinibacteria bacterium]
MAKQIIFDDKARQKVLSGVNQLAAAVRITMGPKGRNVLLEKKFGGPLITNDGVTIAKEIDLKDPEENVGAQLVKEVATRTNDVAGDGTTTATVLAAALVEEGIRNVVAGANPVLLKKGMDKALAKVVEKLYTLAKPVKTKKEIAQVATISAQDEQVGEVLAELMEKVGHDGAITVEETKHGMGLSYKVVEGMQFDNGYISAYMVTDPARMEASYDDVHILLTDKKISSFKELLPLLEALVQSGKKELVVLAEDVDGDALTNLLVNKIRGGFSILAVKAPSFGDRRKEMLKDIAVLTGGTVISDELGLKLENATLEQLGRAGKVLATKDHTMLVDGKGDAKAIEARVAEIKATMEHSKSDFDREKMMERIAKLSGGVGVIEVGAASEVELKEKKMRIEDALNATKAAVKEGIVAGGGSALLHAAKVLEGFEGANEDENIGARLVASVLSMPTRQIAENAGKNGEVVVTEIRRGSSETYGYDALNDRYLDMVEAGIVDPTMVTRSALENAVSVAGTILTTGAVVTEIPEEKPVAGGMPDMSGMM